jgi:hypothetical protein
MQYFSELILLHAMPDADHCNTATLLAKSLYDNSMFFFFFFLLSNLSCRFFPLIKILGVQGQLYELSMSNTGIKKQYTMNTILFK